MPAAPKRTASGRILIIDDNDLGLIARRSVLQELGHEIVTLMEPEKALELCRNEVFDLIVTDFKMPGMNGVELIKQLRNQNTKAPVILLSGFTDALGLTEDNTGANSVIQKSSNEVSHLIRSVNRLLRKTAKKPAASQGSLQARKKAKG